MRVCFPKLEIAFCEFDPWVIAAVHGVREDALRVFRHEGKIDAILTIAGRARDLGDAGVLRALNNDGCGLLGELPYIGPATSRHLAKNLGVAVAKPDRHLLRLSKATCRNDPDVMCGEISRWLGDPVPVVDVVLWRWAVLHRRRCQRRLCDSLPHALAV